MIGVGSLDTLVWQAIDRNLLPEGCRHIVPMIDARRMEVYSAVFDITGRQVRDTAPEIVTEESFADILAGGPVLFIGDGARKCSDVIKSANATFIDACPEAASMLRPAEMKYAASDFLDTAYSEPFYLKQFIPTLPKNKLF